eukprot:Nk52_evm37s914 gene=Nk52_evmTU37s914
MGDYNPSDLRMALHFAEQAEGYTQQGDLLKAIECHNRSAECYKLAAQSLTNRETAKNLMLHFGDQEKRAKELQVRYNVIEQQEFAAAAAAAARKDQLSNAIASELPASPSTKPKAKPIVESTMSPPHTASGPGKNIRLRSDINLADSFKSIDLGGVSDSVSDSFYDDMEFVQSAWLDDSRASVMQAGNGFNARGDKPNDPLDSLYSFWESLEGLVHKLPNAVALVKNPLNRGKENPLEIAKRKDHLVFDSGRTETLAGQPPPRERRTSAGAGRSESGSGSDFGSFFLVEKANQRKSCPEVLPSGIPVVGLTGVKRIDSIGGNASADTNITESTPTQCNEDLLLKVEAMQARIEELERELEIAVEREKDAIALERENQILKESIMKFKEGYKQQVSKLKRSTHSLSGSSTIGAMGGSSFAGDSSMANDPFFAFGNQSTTESDSFLTENRGGNFEIEAGPSHDHCREVKAHLDAKLRNILSENAKLAKEVKRMNDRWEKLKVKARQKQRIGKSNLSGNSSLANSSTLDEFGNISETGGSVKAGRAALTLSSKFSSPMAIEETESENSGEQGEKEENYIADISGKSGVLRVTENAPEIKCVSTDDEDEDAKTPNADVKNKDMPLGNEHKKFNERMNESIATNASTGTVFFSTNDITGSKFS